MELVNVLARYVVLVTKRFDLVIRQGVLSFNFWRPNEVVSAAELAKRGLVVPAGRSSVHDMCLDACLGFV